MFRPFAGLVSTTAYLPYATARSLDSFEEIAQPPFCFNSTEEVFFRDEFDPTGSLAPHGQGVNN